MARGSRDAGEEEVKTRSEEDVGFLAHADDLSSSSLDKDSETDTGDIAAENSAYRRWRPQFKSTGFSPSAITFNLMCSCRAAFLFVLDLEPSPLRESLCSIDLRSDLQ